MSGRFSPVLLALFALGVLSLGVMLAGCSGEQQNAERGKPFYVATTSKVAEVVEAIVGEDAEVYSLIGPGLDPHSYSATRDDIKRIMDADAVFMNGLGLEGQLTSVLRNASKADIPVYAVAEVQDHSVLRVVPGSQGAFDPHVWMDPVAWQAVVERTRDALIQEQPRRKLLFTTRASSYTEELEKLHEELLDAFERIPEDRRIVVIEHASLGYLADRYGLEMEPLRGPSSQSRAGLSRIEEIIELLIDRDVRAVFAESSLNDRGMRAIIEGAADRGHDVKLGGTLFVDAIGGEGSGAESYLELMRHNAKTIRDALMPSD